MPFLSKGRGSSLTNMAWASPPTTSLTRGSSACAWKTRTRYRTLLNHIQLLWHKYKYLSFPLCQQYKVKLSVRNSGAEPVTFTYYTPLHWLKHLALTDEHNVTRKNPRTLRPGEPSQGSLSVISGTDHAAHHRLLCSQVKATTSALASAAAGWVSIQWLWPLNSNLTRSRPPLSSTSCASSRLGV